MDVELLKKSKELLMRDSESDPLQIVESLLSTSGRFSGISKIFLEYLRREGYFTSPASTKYHGSWVGGLFCHSSRVAYTLVNLTLSGVIKDWVRPDSPWIIGLFHDLCKCGRYVYDDTNRRFEIAPEEEDETCLKGHGEKSVMMLSQFIPLTEEEILCIRYHMGPYMEGDREFYSRAISRYPNVLWTHSADMEASQIHGV